MWPELPRKKADGTAARTSRVAPDSGRGAASRPIGPGQAGQRPLRWGGSGVHGRLLPGLRELRCPVVCVMTPSGPPGHPPIITRILQVGDADEVTGVRDQQARRELPLQKLRNLPRYDFRGPWPRGEGPLLYSFVDSNANLTRNTLTDLPEAA